MSPPWNVGVLALQGDFAAHEQALRAAAGSLGLPCAIHEVRKPAHLEGLSGLVLPGGESTTLLKLMDAVGLGPAIVRFVTTQGGALLATCAGAILVSCHVSNPAQESLGLLDATIERNAHGRQVDSFIGPVDSVAGAGLGDEPIEGVFIRAPRFREVGPQAEVLARQAGEPVLVMQRPHAGDLQRAQAGDVQRGRAGAATSSRSGCVLAATFHPELTSDTRVHALFLRQFAA